MSPNKDQEFFLGIQKYPAPEKGKVKSVWN